MDQTSTHDESTAIADADQIVLSPRVVDETAFESFTSKLNQLIGRADDTLAALDDRLHAVSSAAMGLEEAKPAAEALAKKLASASDEIKDAIESASAWPDRIRESTAEADTHAKDALERATASIDEAVKAASDEVERKLAQARESLDAVKTDADELEGRLRGHVTERLGLLTRVCDRAEALLGPEAPQVPPPPDPPIGPPFGRDAIEPDAEAPWSLTTAVARGEAMVNGCCAMLEEATAADQRAEATLARAEAMAEKIAEAAEKQLADGAVDASASADLTNQIAALAQRIDEQDEKLALSRKPSGRKPEWAKALESKLEAISARLDAFENATPDSAPGGDPSDNAPQQRADLGDLARTLEQLARQAQRAAGTTD